MNNFFRAISVALCLVCFSASAMANVAMDEDKGSKKQGALPEAMENALSQLLEASKPGVAPAEKSLQEVLRFVTELPKKVEPAPRPQGAGAFFQDTFRVPLKTIMSYILDPAIPGEALYPSSVRRNDWVAGSEVLTRAAAFLNSPLPPAATLTMHGTEEEETTPDTSSGCHYAYKLNRLFVLTAFEGRSALFSISFMPAGKSSVGNKGIIVGDDRQWNYVYTTEPGTNLAMLGWAETYLYGSASVSVYLSSSDNASTGFYSFKWAKAGWAGSNVVKPSHIVAGVKRFAGGLKQVLESPRRPTPEALKSRMAELNAMDDAGLRAAMTPYVNSLKHSTDKSLDSEYGKAVRDTDYPASMNRQQVLAELIKQFMREQIKP